MWGGMILALTGEVARQAGAAEAEEQKMAFRIASGIPRESARAEMLAERRARFEREEKLAEEMRKLLEPRPSMGVDPLYLGAAFILGMAIG